MNESSLPHQQIAVKAGGLPFPELLLGDAGNLVGVEGCTRDFPPIITITINGNGILNVVTSSPLAIGILVP